MDWQSPTIPEKFRKLYERGRKGSAKSAIRAMCAMCVGWEPGEVERCTATGCPLYTLRNPAAQAQTEAADRAKRRQRALARGGPPPKPSAAGRHGAHVSLPILNAAEGLAIPLQPPSAQEREDAVSAA